MVAGGLQYDPIRLILASDRRGFGMRDSAPSTQQVHRRGADVEYRVATRDGLPAIEFSFVGEDEMDPVSGRGWAVLAEDELRGRLFFHRGDDSALVARRKKGERETPAKKGRR